MLQVNTYKTYIEHSCLDVKLYALSNFTQYAC